LYVEYSGQRALPLSFGLGSPYLFVGFPFQKMKVSDNMHRESTVIEQTLLQFSIQCFNLQKAAQGAAE
jgi:hypothetical protein